MQIFQLFRNLREIGFGDESDHAISHMFFQHMGQRFRLGLEIFHTFYFLCSTHV